MSFSVSRLSECLVRPSEPTPSDRLPLSWMDRISERVLMQTLHVFKHGEEPGKVVKEALAKALVPYYPLAGVYATSDHGELYVDCTGEGVWFVEASADCSLEDVNFMELPLVIPQQEMLPSDRPGIEPQRVMLMMQLTEFACGGFVIGLRFNHGVADGIGAAQFVKAIGEFARGHLHPTIKPVWNRDLIPVPPNMKLDPALPPLADMHLETSITDLSLDRIVELKEKIIIETGKRCSTFDVLLAIIWQNRTRAVEPLPPDANVHISFLASVRHLFSPAMPPEGGYYGNCVSFVNVTASSDKIAHGSLVEVVGLIKEAKVRLSTDYIKYLEGDLSKGAPPPVGYETVIFTDWTRLGFFEVDYGWGGPISVLHLGEIGFIPNCTITKSPGGDNGVRLIAAIVRKEHLGAFTDQMKRFS